MKTIHDQLAWEEKMLLHGVQRYRAAKDRAVETGRSHETRTGSTLLRSYTLQISDHIRLYLNGKHPAGRRRNKFAKLITALDTDKTAMFALKSVIATLFNPVSLVTVATNIGRMVEDELRFSKFEEEYKEYYDAVCRSWEAKNTKSYSHKRNTLAVKSAEKGMEWDAWDKETLMGVGSTIISLLMEVCDLVEVKQVKARKGTASMLCPTDECIEWMQKMDDFAELSHPDKMPCIVPPADWISNTDGGYYSPALRERTPLVKSKGGRRGDQLGEMPDVLRAINAMQRTAWAVNDRVLAVMREVWSKNLSIGMPRTTPYVIPPCPLPEGVKVSELEEDNPARQVFTEWKAEARELYTMEQERVSKNLAVSRVLRMASEMQQHPSFWYVFQCDFRGRVYSATSGLSPQGTDQAKALLHFAKGKQLGARGLYWLKVHGANKYGQDKGDYDERVAWIEERHDALLRAAADPIGERDVWKDADKPYQFLAFIFEYAGAVQEGPGFLSRLPVALDGSCNGLQHFSAMLRDTVGGASVNLTSGERPADIYQNVADVATDGLREARKNPDDGGAANWLDLFSQVSDGGMSRKLSKQPVMTLPYGSTQQACTETIFRWSQETAPAFFAKNTGFKHALYLSPVLWEAIGKVVVAARRAMDWLQTCAGVLAKAGHPIDYTTPLGFRVIQKSMKFKTRQVETQIGGRLRLNVASDTDQIDSRKQRQGSSPNFVHSIDATHMMMCLVAGEEAGISSFAMIHDDFGVHACDTELWHGIIRAEFARLHMQNDVLADFKKQHEERFDVTLPELPPKGDLDINLVLESPYFFG